MKSRNNHNKSLGKAGEDLAADFLEKRGLAIVRRNFRTREGEIDLIARDGETMVFIEVKTRLSHMSGNALEAMDEKKCGKIRRMAEIYLSTEAKSMIPVRFDVITFDFCTESGRWKARWIKEAF